MAHRPLCRQELYPMKYERIDWNAARNLVAKEDLYYPHPWIQVGGWRVESAQLL
jgi:cycloartenol synthase